MALDRGPLKRLLKENGVNSLDEFNGIMRDIRKEVLGTLVEGKLTNHLGYESDLAFSHFS